MKSGATTPNTTANSTISGLLILIEQSINQIGRTEKAVSDWMDSENSISSFPLVDFQRIDFTHQILTDVQKMLQSDKLIAVLSGCESGADVKELSEVAILEYTRQTMDAAYVEPFTEAQSALLNDGGVEYF